MMQNDFDLSGKGAIVTGSSRGIGKAIAEGLANRGADVISERNAGRAIPVAANIGSQDAVKQLVLEAREALSSIDILVCNAASNPYYGPMAGIADEQFEKILRNNLLSNHWLARLVFAEMAKRGRGSIIFISSIGGLRGSPVIGAYNISKAATLQLARNLAVEYGPSGVRVNCIAPGLIRTDFARALWEDEENLAKSLAGTPLGRIGEPEDIAGAAIFLASDAARYVTGETLVVDGGSTVTVGGV